MNTSNSYTDQEIKCPQCGAPLTLQDAVCPYCGSANVFGDAHRRERTEADRALRSSRIRRNRMNTTTALILALSLVLLCLIAGDLYLWRAARVLSYRHYEEVEERAIRNADAYKAQIDDYLEEEQFEAVCEFIDFYDLKFEESYQEYLLIFEQVSAYHYCMIYARHIAYLDTGDYFPDLGNHIGESVNDFYASFDPDKAVDFFCEPYPVDREKTIRAATAMERNIRCMLMSVLHMPEEEALQLSGMRPSARKALIVECYDRAEEYYAKD